MLSDVLLLVLGFTMVIIGLQSFMDPVRRKVASDVIKATFMMIAGFFFLYYWYTGVSANSKVGSNYR